MKWFNTHTILSLLVLLMGAILGLGYGYWFLERTVVTRKEKELTFLVKKQSETVIAYINDKKERAESFIKKDSIKKMLYKNQISEITSKSIDLFEKESGFVNTILINTNGEIVYARQHRDVVGTNLIQDPQNAINLAQSFMRSLLTLTPDNSSLFVNKSTNELIMYQTLPVFDQKKLLGVVSFQYDLTDLLMGIKDNMVSLLGAHTIIGQQRDEKSIQLLDIGFDDKLVTPISFEMSDMLSPIEQALLGNKGSGILRNYIDQKVVGAWNYIPAVAWGMVVTVNFSSVYMPVSLVWYGLITLLIISIILLFLLVWRYRVGFE